jgi:MFS transporter, DHA1 family, multidrug resistance protein
MSQRTIVWLPAVLFATYWGMVKVGLPVYPHLHALLGAQEHTIKLLVSLGFTCAGVAPLLWGPLSDVIGLRRTTLLLVILNVAAVALIVFAPGTTTFGIGLLAGCFVASGLISLGRVVPAVYLTDQTAIRNSFSIAIAGGSLAAFLAPLFSGWVFDAMGWRAAFGVMLAWLVVAFVLVWVFLPRDQRGEKRGDPLIVVRGIRAFSKDPLFWTEIGLGGLPIGLISAFLITSPFWLITGLHVGTGDFAYYLVAPLAALAGSSFLAQHLVKIISGHAVMLLSIGAALLAAGWFWLLEFELSASPIAWTVPGVLIGIVGGGSYAIVQPDLIQRTKQYGGMTSAMIVVVAYGSTSVFGYFSMMTTVTHPEYIALGLAAVVAVLFALTFVRQRLLRRLAAAQNA